MSIETTYSNARAHFAELCDKAVDDRETIIVKRRGGRSVAIIAFDELTSLEETAHLVRSPKNALRLLQALERAYARAEEPMTVEQLRREVGLDG
ncbi:MAG: type II toxin-antitoxin system prevent-host-death family antitoxin [Dehalococcoidia bacterium]|nr:type II toxin-antitoxin system prevent-host-death family antitoxin [Dehalococcoidia bacterium]